MSFTPSQLVFQLTVRSLSCSEISDDAALVSRLNVLYDKLDSGTTPATVLMPWLPTPAMIKKLWATKEIYDIVVRAINAREQSSVSRNDTLQMLLDNGDEKMVIVGVGGLFSSSPKNLYLSRHTVYHGASNCRCTGYRYHRYASFTSRSF